jgi:hypothetical protein
MRSILLLVDALSFFSDLNIIGLLPYSSCAQVCILSRYQGATLTSMSDDIRILACEKARAT